MISIEILGYRGRQMRQLIGSAVILSTSAANVVGNGKYLESMEIMEAAEKILQLI